MNRVLLGLLLSCGCATTHVAERYVLVGDAQAIARAAEEATRRLGWTTEAIASGKFKLLESPRKPAVALTVSASDGVLQIEGELPTNQPDMPETARILRSATAEILDGRPRDPVSPRSPVIGGILDVLVPSAGALYALQGNPYFDSHAVNWRRSFWWDVSNRLVIDATSGILLGVFVKQANEGFGINPWAIVVAEIAILVLNRIGALLTDVSAISYRNAYARSGLGAPEEH